MFCKFSSFNYHTDVPVVSVRMLDVDGTQANKGRGVRLRVHTVGRRKDETATDQGPATPIVEDTEVGVGDGGHVGIDARLDRNTAHNVDG